MKNLPKIFLTIAMTIFLTGFIYYDGDVYEDSHAMYNNATQWELDKDHSNVRFTIRHLGIAEVDGLFREFTSSMQSSMEDYSDAIINMTIDVNSIDSNNPARDTHLKSNDFFNVASFPIMTFESKTMKPGKGNNFKLSGKLTIRDVSKNITFDVEHMGTISVTGMKKTAFKASTTINRFDYNLNWNTTTPEGLSIVDNEVTITLNLEFNQVSI